MTSTWLRFAVHPEGILKVIEGYSAVYDKLVAIDSRYPTGKHLRTLVGEHVVKYGMEGVGQEFDSGGSEALIRAVDKQDPDGRPLHVCLWGGANCLAQVGTPRAIGSKLISRLFGGCGRTGKESNNHRLTMQEYR